jgi:hypothetical protein
VAFLPILQEAQRIWSDPEYMQTIPKAEVCFECKFMSDISHETTHHYGSNQIARIIDVGWSFTAVGTPSLDADADHVTLLSTVESCNRVC